MATVLKPQDEHLPRFPSSDEIRESRNNRVRLGGPDATDDTVYYIHRYNRILAGVSPTLLTTDEFLFGYKFEWTLADLKACEACDGQCRTFQGRHQYMDFDRGGYEAALKRYNEQGGRPPKPRFVVRNCADAKQRMRQLAEFYRGVTYR